MTTDPAHWPCVHVTRAGVTLDLLVAPNAKRTQAMGLHDGALRVRLAAAPVDGAANEALLRWVAAELQLPRQAVTLLRGETSKRKVLVLDVAADVVLGWLARVNAAP